MLLMRVADRLGKTLGEVKHLTLSELQLWAAYFRIREIE
jgi:hypothetical protein